jgi:hypothetical protein
VRWSGADRFQVGCEAASVEKTNDASQAIQDRWCDALPSKSLNLYRKIPTNADGDTTEKNEECFTPKF